MDTGVSTSVWIKHLDDNLIMCFKVKAMNCQAVVGPFGFLKDEQPVPPQVDVSTLVVHPGPFVARGSYSEPNPVTQETRHPGVPRRRLPVDPDPAVLVVAHRSEVLNLWTSRWRFPSFAGLFRSSAGVCIPLLIILHRVFIFFIVIRACLIIVLIVIFVILRSDAMHTPQENKESEEEGYLPKAPHRPE